MPASRERFGIRPSDRAYALFVVAVVHVGLALALLSGLNISVERTRQAVTRLVDIALPPPPAPQPRSIPPRPHPRPQMAAAASSPHTAQPGGSPGRATHGNTVIAEIPVRAAPALSTGGGAGTGMSQGAGKGGGNGVGGSGEEEGDGGADLVQIAGAIFPSDYPRDLREAGIGGRVGLLFTVGVNGRVTRCAVTRSSGNAELDALTCRLIQERFRYRPSTDASGRPIEDEVEGEHDWSSGGRDGE